MKLLLETLSMLIDSLVIARTAATFARNGDYKSATALYKTV
jgi:hypothetical protein